MSRALLKSLLGTLELLVALSALFGGFQLMRDPSGLALQLPGTHLLAGTPFPDYYWPGVILLVVNGVFPIVVGIASALGQAWSRWGHLAVGALLTGWMAVQLAMIGYVFALQGVMLALGLLMLGLASSNFVSEGRDEPPSHHPAPV